MRIDVVDVGVAGQFEHSLDEDCENRVWQMVDLVMFTCKPSNPDLCWQSGVLCVRRAVQLPHPPPRSGRLSLRSSVLEAGLVEGIDGRIAAWWDGKF